MSNELEISPQAYDIASRQVDDSIVYFRLSHYLSRLNYIERLAETKNGSIIAPRKMLTSVAYGFARNDAVFCLHLTGVLFEFFDTLFPIESIIIDEGDYQGIALMLKPLKYADYSFPPLKIFFPNVSRNVFNRLSDRSKTLCITRIERSLIDPKKQEFVRVSDSYVKISTISDFEPSDDANDNYLGIYS